MYIQQKEKWHTYFDIMQTLINFLSSLWIKFQYLQQRENIFQTTENQVRHVQSIQLLLSKDYNLKFPTIGIKAHLEATAQDLYNFSFSLFVPLNFKQFLYEERIYIDIIFSCFSFLAYMGSIKLISSSQIKECLLMINLAYLVLIEELA